MPHSQTTDSSKEQQCRVLHKQLYNSKSTIKETSSLLSRMIANREIKILASAILPKSPKGPYPDLQTIVPVVMFHICCTVPLCLHADFQ